MTTQEIVYRKLKIAKGAIFSGGRFGKRRKIIDVTFPEALRIREQARVGKVSYEELDEQESRVLMSSIHGFASWVIDGQRNEIVHNRLRLAPDAALTVPYMTILEHLKLYCTQPSTAERCEGVFREAASVAIDDVLGADADAQFSYAIQAVVTFCLNRDVREALRRAVRRIKACRQGGSIQELLLTESDLGTEDVRLATIWDEVSNR